MRSNIVLIDSRVTGYQTLIDNLATPSEVFIIDAGSDGLAQIAARLQGRSDIDALHLISHGSQGALYLGTTVLDSSNLASYATQLASIGGALTQTGDILLYGCNVAQGDAGLQFISALAQATGADVAASSNATGASILGGDAVLEQVSGSVEAASLALNGLTGLLAVAGDGMVTTAIGAYSDYGRSVTLQADGKILLAGYSDDSSGNGDFALVRYNSNGSLDSSFSGDGMLTTDFGTSDDEGYSVTLQADGKILLARAINYGGYDFFALVRYNSNGSLDSSFSGDGMLATVIGAYDDVGQSVTLQADGKILLAGYSDDSSGINDFALVRYNSNGTLDTSFSGDGMLTTDFGTSDDVANSVTLQADGKILLAGSINNGVYNYFALARYNSDGSLDSSFSGSGMLITAIGAYDDYGQSVTLQADGKILLAGYSDDSSGNSDFALVRYNSNGSLDTSFSGDGMLTTDFGTSDDEGYNVTLQADGKILLAGASNYNGYDYFALARYNSDGSLDSSFSGDGMLITAIGAYDDYGRSVTLQADGKILLAGTSYDSSGNGDFALVRYNSNGSLDTSFGVSNNSPTGFVTISGTATQGQTLTAVNTLADLDGLGTMSYQWLANGTAISGATASTLVLAAAQVGKTISVKASYTDGQATAESVTSAATGAVAVLSEPGVTFRNATALTTTEAGGTAAFQVVLNAAPRYDVVLTLSINDATEGKFQASGKTTTTVTFTAANWNVAQTVTLVGVDDKPNDHNMVFVVSTSASSEDLRYAGMGTNSSMPIANLSVTNIDNDVPDEWYGDTGGTAVADQHFGGNGASDLYGKDGRDELHGNNGDDRLYGSYGDDVLYGDADNDELEGDQGNDKLNGGTGNDNLNGGTGKDTLLGGDGNDTLDGSSDADSMNGGNGADTYYVDNTGDIVNDSGTDTGKDTVYITAFLATGYTLGAGIDNAALQAQANNASLTGNTGDNSLTGNASNNALSGGAGADDLTGGDGADSLNGGLGNDILYAGSGDDVVDAGDGNDLIVGGDGAGNDRYTGGAGIDTVKYTSATAAITVNLTSGSASGTNIGSDTLAQIENVIGGKGSDSLTGNTLANGLSGDTGNDTLNGGAGADNMTGGDGSDTYYVDNISDVVSETNAVASTGGTDTVYSYLSAYTLGANVENGRILSAGTAGLTGNATNNTLYAGAGNNVLNGGSGTDTVSYAYATTAVKVSLALATGQITGGSGTDTLTSIENLIGSNFNDTLTGGTGNNMLYGRAGSDVLKGGLGIDQFVFDTTLGASNVDTLTDFVHGSDKIVLDDDIFTKLGITGTSSGAALTTAKFQLGAANDSGDRIIYNQTSGALYYDADGSGVGVAVQIALIGTTTHTALTATDFLVVA